MYFSDITSEFHYNSLENQVSPVQSGYLRRKISVGKYHCDACSYKSNYLSNLKRHYIIHTGQCPYSCNICGRSFNQRDSLKRHYKVHGHMLRYNSKVAKGILHSDNIK